MPKTRDRITTPGDYVSTCGCGTRIAGEVGLYFPRCIACGQEVEWKLFVQDKVRDRPAANEEGVESKDVLLVRHGFVWTQNLGVWMNESQRKMISGRAVRAISLAELRAFVEQPPQVDWQKIFGN